MPQTLTLADLERMAAAPAPQSPAASAPTSGKTLTLSDLEHMGAAPESTAPGSGEVDIPHPFDAALPIVSAWWNQVKHGPLNLYETGKSLAGLATGDTESAMGAENAALWQKAKDAYNAGDYTGATAHALNYMVNGIPGLGGLMEGAGEKFASGDVNGGIGDTLGIATNYWLGAKVPEAIARAKTGVEAMPGAVNRLVAADPVIAVNKALKFRPTADLRDIPGALADVKAAEVSPTTGNETLLQNIKAAKSANRAAFDKWIDNKGDVPVSGAPILAATAASIPETMWIENPKLAQSIIDSAKGYAADLTAEKLARILEEKNGELNSFYNRAQSAQQAAVQSGAPEAVVKAQRDSAAAILYDFLDPANKGAGPRLIQRRYGAIQELEEAAQARANAIAREKAVSPAGKVVDIAQGAGQLLKLDPEKAFHTWAGSDSLIRRALANTDADGVYPEP